MVSPPDLRTGEEEGPGAGGVASRPGAQVVWLQVRGLRWRGFTSGGSGGVASRLGAFKFVILKSDN